MLFSCIFSSYLTSIIHLKDLSISVLHVAYPDDHFKGVKSDDGAYFDAAEINVFAKHLIEKTEKRAERMEKTELEPEINFSSNYSNKRCKDSMNEVLDMRDFPFESLPEVVVFRILDHLSYDQVAKMRIIDN